MSIQSWSTRSGLSRSSWSVRCGAFWPTTPGTGPFFVRMRIRCATSTAATQPPTPRNQRKPSSSMCVMTRPISSMWPSTATDRSPSAFTVA
jgi:hypothetical protein